MHKVYIFYFVPTINIEKQTNQSQQNETKIILVLSVEDSDALGAVQQFSPKRLQERCFIHYTVLKGALDKYNNLSFDI